MVNVSGSTIFSDNFNRVDLGPNYMSLAQIDCKLLLIYYSLV